MLIIVIGAYLIVTFILTIIGLEKNSEGLKVFILSLVLTPLFGFVYLLKNRRKATKISYYYCDECDYVYPIRMKHCPICLEKGKKVKLKRYESPNKLTEVYTNLSLA
jgi:hypothetical protein